MFICFSMDAFVLFKAVIYRGANDSVCSPASKFLTPPTLEIHRLTGILEWYVNALTHGQANKSLLVK